ncbi:uncharacterized protein K444DRAFT_622744 [Hyaloscypha bicolor E]|uniref:Uncharacterized protein n=1 Tax=Hyaloscypha bicolor E TaxID=1095630 RepID=A0A2J6SEI6_9HELO|nr:uncharacterized protein K444DRAFT_622744 [Hyaloscypha bicolor E]PMD49185.1 hypothetical protein K444DRAFT_622744 [Hyaloscypha bicolor E]
MVSQFLLALAAITTTTFAAPSQQQSSTVPNVFWTIINLARGALPFHSAFPFPSINKCLRLHPINPPLSILLLRIRHLGHQRPARLHLPPQRLRKSHFITEHHSQRPTLEQLRCLSLQWQ